MFFAALFKRGFLALVLVLVFLATSVHAAVDLETLFDDDLEVRQEGVIYDPLEPLNRVFFTFNDRLYFWLLKPVGKVYTAVLADEAVRGCISAAFHNVLAPVRVVNNLLQGKFKESGTEVARFAINTVFGAGGLGDPAAEEFGLAKADEDLGQTLGFYGVGEGFYICLPLFGPSSARDTVGMVGDYFLDPLQYILVDAPRTNIGLTALKNENAATLKGKDYEGLVSQAFDPYISLRDIYYQHRRSLIANATPSGHQEMMAERDKGFSGEQCHGLYGKDVFRNLIRARKYQQCLNNMGAQASVNRTQKQGRAIYMVIVDEQVEAGQRLARVTDVVGGDGKE